MSLRHAIKTLQIMRLGHGGSLKSNYFDGLIRDSLGVDESTRICRASLLTWSDLTAMLSRAPMRKSAYTLFTVVALLIGLAFAFHAEDLPETPYDESQVMASEHYPFFLIQVLQESVQRVQPTQKSVSPMMPSSPATGEKTPLQARNLSAQPELITPNIRAVPLRC